MSRFIWVLATLTGIVGFLLGLVVARTEPGSSVGRDGPAPGASLQPLVVETAPGVARGAAAGPDFASVAARVNGAVVNVDSAVRGDASRAAASRWRRDLAEDSAMPREGTGSGFIIDPAGYILTNFHVVDGADRLTVTLVDGRAFKADVAGVDPALDVALIKIASPDPLPVVILGESGTLQVGQWVCAIGNPLGYVHSVTVGVVSFLGRKLFDQALDAYIQTDAAISLGNSGGPLIDAAGRVIGITTAVSSQAANIGFAVPISQVVAVLPQLRELGRVSRGDVGAGVTKLTAPLVAALHLSVDRGALVQDVGVGTPAERAGLRAYDVIVAADGAEIRSDDELIRHVAARAPGTLTILDVVRGAVRERIAVKLTERPVPPSAQGRMPRADVRPAAGQDQGPLGFTVRDLYAESTLRKALPDTIRGVVVVEVDPAGPARLARIRVGQMVLEINRQPTPTADAFEAVVAGIAPGEAVVALVYDSITSQRVLVAIVPDRKE